MWLGYGMAVAVAEACSCSSNWTPSLRTSICHRCSPKKEEEKKQNVVLRDWMVYPTDLGEDLCIMLKS